MRMTDLDDVTALLVAFDPMRGGPASRSNRDDAVRWIEWQERNHAEHGFGLWVVETHDGAFVGDCGLTVQDVEGAPHVEVGYHLVPRDAPAGLRHRGGPVRARLRGRPRGRPPRGPRPSGQRRPRRGSRGSLGMEVERTAHVHGGDALVFGMHLGRP